MPDSSPDTACMTARQIDTSPLEKDGLKIGTAKIALNWFFSQSSQTMALYIVIVLIVGSAYLFVKHWMPEHTAKALEAKKEMAERFERLTKYNTDSRERMEKQHLDETRAQREQNEKNCDRIERLFQKRFGMGGPVEVGKQP